jgi:cbb3-type cytochrome oxidase subunit 3
MFKDVVRSLDTGILAIIGLVAFILAFILIIARVITMKKSERTAHKQLPLEDDEKPHV